MKNLIFTTALVTALIGLAVPAASDSHSGSETTTLTSIDTVAVATLLTNWEAETDVLTKAAIAKEIQAALGVTVDGLIGRRTISAIKAAGISTGFTKPTRAENGTAKLALAVSDGTLTQEQADSISVGRASIKEIQEKAKAGSLTENAAKAQIEAIRANIAVTSGRLTQEQADSISVERASIKEIQEKAKVGSLTKNAAKAQIEAIRVNIAVTSGRLTQEQADMITQGKASITEIKDKVKAGDLTKNEAKAQISAVRDTMPAKPEVGFSKPDRNGASGQNGNGGKGSGSKDKKKKKKKKK